MRTVITAERLWNGTHLIAHPVITVEDGHISSIAMGRSVVRGDDTQTLDFPGATLGPAFFDVHIHGAAGRDVMEATPEALDTIGGFLATRGTGSFLATTVTAPIDATLKAVSGLAKIIAREPVPGQARAIGIHIEGPFLSHAKRGVQPAAHLLAPDIKIFDQLYDAAEGHVRLMTLAPELPGAVDLAAHATGRGVRVSIGHSNATADEATMAIKAGAISATHTFNAMRALDHREPGILGTVLTTDSLYAELICDGIHTAPEMVKIWWRAKGPERAMLITDAMSAAGMPDGAYTLGGFAVQVKDGRAMADGVLAGSVLTLDRALANFVRFTGATVEQGLRLLTANPAAMTGFGEQASSCHTGSVRLGQRADLAAVDADGKLVACILGGKQVSNV
jgi:N-acetylglucosamine-6-phosphate deacetylase